MRLDDEIDLVLALIASVDELAMRLGCLRLKSHLYQYGYQLAYPFIVFHAEPRLL